jgi:hypothetical protein
VQWIWTEETPSNYEIQRSTSQNSGFSTIDNALPGDINYFEDTPPVLNTIYYYRVRAKNNCGDWGSYSTPVSGYAPSAPSNPGNISHSIANNSIQIS